MNKYLTTAFSPYRLANVAGTQEPIYGPSAIRSVAEQASTVPHTELTRDDLKWVNMDSTSVETQVFYLTADSGHLAFVQVIHSNVAYVYIYFMRLYTRGGGLLESSANCAGVRIVGSEGPASSTPRSSIPGPRSRHSGRLTRSATSISAMTW